MRKKRNALKKILPIIILMIVILVGVVKVNIINTRRLSPLGNGIKNYEIANKKFGKDFSNFINDKCDVKIYCEEGKDILIKFEDEDFTIKNISKVANQFEKKVESTIRILKGFSQNLIKF